jgi:hypothetical protein
MMKVELELYLEGFVVDDVDIEKVHVDAFEGQD